jgi:hypothetical protein
MERGHYTQLMDELEREEPDDFKSFLRMDPALFQELSQRLEGRLTKMTTNARRPLEPSLKLAITLRFLATGTAYRQLAFQFRVAHNTISLLIPDVCNAIIAEFEDETIKLPQNPAEWKEVSDLYARRWNFEHCCGAIDGKHIAIKRPTKSGTTYHNYKNFFSMILLALVDGDYKFMWVDVGANGSTSDTAVFNDTNLKLALQNGQHEKIIFIWLHSCIPKRFFFSLEMLSACLVCKALVFLWLLLGFH